MKSILLLAALLLGFSAAQAQTSQEPMRSKSSKKAIRKQRRQNGPEVYKGSVAEQRRIVTDAPGAEKEDGSDEATPKKNKRKN